MIDIHAHTQVGNFWRFKYSYPDLDEVPKFQVRIDFPASRGNDLGEICGYRFPIPVDSGGVTWSKYMDQIVENL